MQHPVKRTTLLLLLLAGSAVLILGPAEYSESHETSQIPNLPKSKALTALPAQQPQATRTPEQIGQSEQPVKLAPPIPLPPPQFRTKPRTTPAARAPKPKTRTVRMLVTAYCPCKKCCGRFSDNITANGKSIYANRSMFVAADTRILKFGTMISVPGYRGGRSVPVWDRGGKIKGYRLDVFYLSHRQAKKWGRRYLDVKVSIAKR